MVGRTHVVLGGGGAMGAYQAGALAGLLEAGVVPDGFFGCSVGALHAAFLATAPDAARARELESWWSDRSAHAVLAPTWRASARSMAAALRAGGRSLLDAGPLRRLVQAQVGVPEVAGLAVPLTVTTTCLDCAAARHHDDGPLVDLLVASCALPGLFPPVRLADGHLHVDGGVVAGVPVAAALQVAGPDDEVLVLDCGLAPVTGRVDSCAALSPALAGRACGLPVQAGRDCYVAPVESSRGALDVVLQAFTVARAVANRAGVERTLDDPRVQVLPHVADAWAAGLLPVLPRGPRDFGRTDDLVRAGREAARVWLDVRSDAAAP